MSTTVQRLADLRRSVEDVIDHGFWAAALVCFLSGALLTYALPPVSFFPVIFIGLPFLFSLLTRAATIKRAFWLGWWAGFGFFLFGISWIAESFQQQSNVPPELAPFAVALLNALLSFYWALFFSIHKAISRTLRTHSRLWSILLFASLFVLIEAARGVLFSGFPWNLMTSVWADWLWTAQLIRYVGTYGLSFLTVLLALFVGEMVYNWLQGNFRSCLQFATIPFLFLSASLAGGWLLNGETTRFVPDISLHLVQANIAQKDKWDRALIDDHFAKHIRLSRASLARADQEIGIFADTDSARVTAASGKQSTINLVIWPEVAVQTLDFDRGASLQRYQVSRLLPEGSFALTGARRYERHQNGVRLFNSLFAVSPTGQIVDVYDKKHLVPFSEYMPFKALFSALGLQQLTGGQGFNAGQTRTAISLRNVPPLSPLICYEVIFPGRVMATSGAVDWMLTITNDAWFGLSSGPHQHFAQARLRAIEEATPIVRVASTGISGVIDGMGRTVKSLGLDREGVIISGLPLKPNFTPLLSSGLRNALAVAFLILLTLGSVTIGRYRS